MQIDHDPNEPSRRAIIIMAGVGLVITIGIMLVLKYGLEQVVDFIPLPIQTLIGGLAIGFGVGMRLGWWDSERYHSRTKGRDG